MITLLDGTGLLTTVAGDQLERTQALGLNRLEGMGSNPVEFLQVLDNDRGTSGRNIGREQRDSQILHGAEQQHRKGAASGSKTASSTQSRRRLTLERSTAAYRCPFLQAASQLSAQTGTALEWHVRVDSRIAALGG